ncbi:MAG TPA: hypothetical protein VFD82_02465 [Planctomycetota bacterium]|nr:hypothetical protein [Planctomycetota bacterium]
MSSATSPAIGPATVRGTAHGTPLLLLVLVGSLPGGCGGSLSHRAVAEMANTLPIGQAIERIRIEIQNGSLDVDANSERAVAIAGGVRRAADTAEELAQLQQIPNDFYVANDAAEPATLVVRGPAIPAGGVKGVLGILARIGLPADLPLAIVISGSGHVTVANRRASTHVETGRGDLRFEHCASAVEAETGLGMVIAFDHRGDLDITTKHGDMQVFVREPGDLIRLDTGKGTVQCHVPSTIEFDLDARAVVGHIGNGFGLVPQPVLDFGRVLVGKRGSARTKVVLRTGSGHLSIAPRSFEQG